MKTLFLLIGLFVSNLLLAQVDYDRQIENFTSEISRKIDTSKHYKVGIMEFVNNDKNETQLGEIIADDISAELANLSSNSTKFEVLERSRLDQIFKEKKLIKNYDSKDATELGKINAVNILIIGTIVPFGDYYKVTIKLLDSRSGSVLSSVKGQLAKTKAIDELYYKNNTNVQIENPSSKNPLIPVVEPQKNTTNGWVEFENKANETLTVYISMEQAVQNLTASVYEQITISKNTIEKMPSLKVGVYYLFAMSSSPYGNVKITKKFEIIGGTGSKVILQF